MALFQALCSFLIQKGLYFQSKRPNFIPIENEQWEILKLVQCFLDIPLVRICQFSFYRRHLSQENIWQKLKIFVIYFFTKKSNKTFELYRTFKFWSKCQNESSREREKIVQGPFVGPTEIFKILRFEISRVFSPEEVRNVQGTEEFVRAIKKFEKLSIRVFKSQLCLSLCLHLVLFSSCLCDLFFHCHFHFHYN